MCSHGNSQVLSQSCCVTVLTVQRKQIADGEFSVSSNQQCVLLLHHWPHTLTQGYGLLKAGQGKEVTGDHFMYGNMGPGIVAALKIETLSLVD